MPNKNYIRGRKKEYQICKELKDKGFVIAQRSAGSHSPIDIFAINPDTRTILFIQAKSGAYEEKEKAKAYEQMGYLNQGEWNVRFEAR